METHMQSYLVTLDFSIAFALCDPTPGKTPPGTPEKIAAEAPNGTMTLVCMEQRADDNKTCLYRCEQSVDADGRDGLRDALTAMFDHLPGFEVLEATVEPVKQPPATTATKEYVVVCHFRSTDAYFRLNNAFYEHVAEGFFFAAPKKPGHYVAYVVMRTPSSDGLEKAVEGVLRTAFDAHSAETADHFAEVTTNLL
jgi:hypothetical protein